MNQIRFYLRIGLLLSFSSINVQAASVFFNEKFTEHDAILVVDQTGQDIYQWRSNQPLIPASLTKLVTTYLAIDKWGLEHRFNTEFYLLGEQLWVKGYGDPFLISEELDVLADSLNKVLDQRVTSLHIDASYFASETAPGRSRVSDPYNAPLSAVAANFNTVKLQRKAGVLKSAEPQTPLTSIVRQLANGVGEKPIRVNLSNLDIAQQHFAELLVAKLGRKIKNIEINQNLPAQARLVYLHKNSHTLSEVLTGALKFSNNFIANQLFLLLGEEAEVRQMGFKRSIDYVRSQFDADGVWASASIVDGAGLSRKNRMTTRQLQSVLSSLRGNKTLLKEYPIKLTSNTTAQRIVAKVYAKTGTLDSVHSFAGFLQITNKQYQFVFMFNRKMPGHYRERLLQRLAQQLLDGSD